MLRDVKQQFQELLGEAATRRRAIDIAMLPKVEFKGRELSTIECEGPFGAGAHKVNVPDTLLWNLMDLRHFRCPFHA